MTPMRRPLTAWVCLALLAGLAGCGDRAKPAGPEAPDAGPSPYARVMDGVVGNYATYVGGADVVVRGYGLVAGLGDKGSSDTPREIRQRIAAQMTRYGIGRSSTGTEDITPDRIINDRDTTDVVVSAEIPPGTPKGTRLDAFVSARPGSETVSLDGGVLYTTELQRFHAEGGRVREGQSVATVQGEVFVNPFKESQDDDDTTHLLQGRIIGGATSLEQRPIRLVLAHPDYGLAQAVQQAINEKYPFNPHVARAISPSFIDMRIPDKYRHDHERFLQSLLYVYISRQGVQKEQKVRQLAEEILQPAAPYEQISLVWEVMGRQVWPVVRPLYTHASPSVSYAAARAALRQGDEQAMEVVIVAARDAAHPHRMDAIRELGRSGEMAAAEALTGMLDSDDAGVRVAAYEAMSEAGMHGAIEHLIIDEGRIEIDVVPTTGKFLIYASREKRPRIALFGPGMQLRRPVFFTAPDDLVTVLARAGDKHLCVYRRVGPDKRLSDPMYIPYDVKSLVTVLGTRPHKQDDGSYYGLGLTYSQVVGVLYRLCQDGPERRIPADFILQRPDQADRIYAGPEPISRPDTTDEE